MPRTPQTIAIEARAQFEDANTLFVPVNIVRAGQLAVEFMESVVAALDVAGLLPAEPVEEKPAD